LGYPSSRIVTDRCRPLPQSVLARPCRDRGEGWLRVTDARFANLSAVVFIPMCTVVGDKLLVQVPWASAKAGAPAAADEPASCAACVPAEGAAAVEQEGGVPTGYGYRLGHGQSRILAAFGAGKGSAEAAGNLAGGGEEASSDGGDWREREAARGDATSSSVSASPAPVAPSEPSAVPPQACVGADGGAVDEGAGGGAAPAAWGDHQALDALGDDSATLSLAEDGLGQASGSQAAGIPHGSEVSEVGDEVEEDMTDALVAADAGASRGLPLRAQDEDWEMQVSEGDDGDGFSQEKGLAAALHDEGSAPAAAADATHEAELGLAPPPTATSVPSSVPPPAALACQHCGRGFAKRNGGMLSHIRACAAKLGGIEGAVQNTGLSPPRVHTSADTNDLDAMLA